MDLFEELAKLKVEKAMKAIEVAARVMEEAGQRLHRKVELCEEFSDKMAWAGEKVERYARQVKEATSEDERRDAMDNLESTLDEINTAQEGHTYYLQEEAKEDEERRLREAGHGRLEGHLHR